MLRARRDLLLDIPQLLATTFFINVAAVVDLIATKRRKRQHHLHAHLPTVIFQDSLFHRILTWLREVEKISQHEPVWIFMARMLAVDLDQLHAQLTQSPNRFL